MNPNNLKLLRFNNPPGKNLCFSNVIASCLLNIPPLRKFLQEKNYHEEQRQSIGAELSYLSKQKNNKQFSTQRLRTIIMNRCFESGQLTKEYNSNMQYDCVEFLQSLLEHFWVEPTIPDNLGEAVFGGIFQECYHCECGNVEQHPMKVLPNILSLPIKGDSVQTCLDAYFACEKIDKRCSNCQSMQSLKTTEISVPPTTLILQLNRFSYIEAKYAATKLHVPVNCPLNLSLMDSAMYQLNSVINHMGNTTNSGHYNILLQDKSNEDFILVDDIDMNYNSNITENNKVSYVVIYDKL